MAGTDRLTLMEPDALRPDPERYSFSWPPEEERTRLAESVARVGVLRPLWVREEGGGLTVVAGHRRLDALRRVGASSVPVRITDLEGPALWDLLLEDHADHRPWNPVEAGLYLRRRTADTGEALEGLAETVFPRLGLAPRPQAARDALWFAGLPAPLRDGVVEGRVPSAAARALAGVPEPEALSVLTWLSAWRLGGNRFAELARLALECAWAEGAEVEGWLRAEGLWEWKGTPEGLRAELRARRFPTVTRWEGRFRRVVKDLEVPEGVRVEAPQHFEGGELRCAVAFRSLEELARRLGEARRAAESGAWDALAEFLG